jgi:lipoprotein NlpI
MRICGLALALLLSASPATADDADDCNQSEDPQLRVVGCTAMLESGEWAGRDRAEILNNRGIGYDHLGLAQQAIDDFDAALAVDPDYLFAYINRGWAYNDLPQLFRALDDFNHVIAVSPGTPIAYLGRGVTQLNQGGWLVPAIADFDKAIALLPTFVEAYHYRGNAYRRMAEYGRALSDYAEVLRLDPDRAYVHRDRAFAYCWMGDGPAALADFTTEWSMTPAAVVRDQERLREYRHYRGTVSGIADAATHSALKAWVAQGCL